MAFPFRTTVLPLAASLVAGCAPQGPLGMNPGRLPGRPWPPGQPLTQPLVPVVPVTGNVPGPGLPTPVTPTVPTSPTVPLTQPDGPQDRPAGPPQNVHDFWVAWPLPPRTQNVRGQQQSASQGSQQSPADRNTGRPLQVAVAGGSAAADQLHESAGLPGRLPSFGERVSGVAATPAEDLKYRGGRTIPDLKFVNLYIGGDDCWSQADIQHIDAAISAAMSDRHLNNVMMQYFNNRAITSQALPSHPLIGYRPARMTQGDVEHCLTYLLRKGYLQGYDLSSTIFNFLLPRGTVLTDDTVLNGTAAAAAPGSEITRQYLTSVDEQEPVSAIPHAEESSSLMGLGGYHGSIRVNGTPVYYTADVYSERLSDGHFNGIPVFSEPWKNVVATLYHELNEARTDPDVQDAIRNAADPSAERFLGWTSDRGEECGDYPIDESRDLSTIVREVPLADGSGTVPVQFQYSNAVHGPEGPIAEPHPLK